MHSAIHIRICTHSNSISGPALAFGHNLLISGSLTSAGWWSNPATSLPTALSALPVVLRRPPPPPPQQQQLPAPAPSQTPALKLSQPGSAPAFKATQVTTSAAAQVQAPAQGGGVQAPPRLAGSSGPVQQQQQQQAQVQKMSFSKASPVTAGASAANLPTNPGALSACRGQLPGVCENASPAADFGGGLVVKTEAGAHGGDGEGHGSQAQEEVDQMEEGEEEESEDLTGVWLCVFVCSRMCVAVCACVCVCARARGGGSQRIRQVRGAECTAMGQ